MNKPDQVIWCERAADACGNSLSEAVARDIEKIFTRKVCEIIVEALDIPWKVREVFTSLLETHLGEYLQHPKGLLNQYLNHNIETLGKTIKHEFGIEAAINFNHAPHAKFSDIVKELKAREEKHEAPSD